MKYRVASKDKTAPTLKPGDGGMASGHISMRGRGKKKIRKVQRKRAQQVGWHGNHPEQKPREKYGKREALTDVPMFSPKRLEKEWDGYGYVETAFDDDYETYQAPDAFSWEYHESA